jgi:hypothetical protein
VTKLDSTGSSFEYSTFLGGSGSEFGPGGFSVGRDSIVSIAVTPSGEAFVSGLTGSHDFPVVRPIQPAHGGGGFDAFFARFDANGLPQAATYLGGSGEDFGHGIALSPDGSAVMTGFTSSLNFPMRDPLQAANHGADEAFIARIVEDTPDGTPPSTDISLSGVSGSLAWYRSPVMVTLTASDPDGPADVAFIDYRLNGERFARYSNPFTISNDGVSQITARATDNSGTVESTPSSAVVMIDTTAPTIAIGSPEQRDYLHTDVLTLDFSARDDGSGIGSGIFRRSG